MKNRALFGMFFIFMAFACTCSDAAENPIGTTSCEGTTKASTLGQEGHIGTATMSADGVIIYSVKGETVGQGSKIVTWKFSPGSPGYSSAFKHIGGIKPGQRKYIPPYSPSAGSVTMVDDGVIIIHLNTDLAGGGKGEGVVRIKPSERGYKDILTKVCGLKPGETKPLPLN